MNTKTQVKPSNVATAARIATADVVDFVRARTRREKPELSDDQQRAVEDLRRDGFAVVEGYWPREQALGLRDRLEAHLSAGKDHDFDAGAYLRFQDGGAYDGGVRRIYHVDLLEGEGELEGFRHDPWVGRIAEAYYGMSFHSGVLVFQHNTKSNANTRYYHVDSFAREFKSFLYLDDVDEGNGPFTYLRGTQKHHLTRIRKHVRGNANGAATSFSPEDLKSSLEDEVQIRGEAGTLILADVRGFHRGSPQLQGSRSVLVNYIFKEPGDRLLAK